MDESSLIKAIRNIVEAGKVAGYEQGLYEKALLAINSKMMFKEQEEDLKSLLPQLEALMNTPTQKAFLGQSAQT